MANKAKNVTQGFSPEVETKEKNTEQNTVQNDGVNTTVSQQETSGKCEIEKSELDRLIQELKQKEDMLLRLAAEYDNYKKRTEREREALAEYVKANIIKLLLPTLDNTERALASDPSSPDYIKGIELILKQFKEVLTGLGLSEIQAEGQQFNPELHEAVMHIEDDSFGENTVVKVLQKGYKVGGTVIRPAMVQVAN
ncbi:MAG TPA: nucleotide exchange factor GrpE [Clostridiales bacterium]|nr:nucleotide exchange factor GrpE [Clostridiales bacterium]